jgi:hypothetical protein
MEVSAKDVCFGILVTADAQMRRRNVGGSSSQILHSGGITGQRR